MPKDIARRILRCIWIILALSAATTVSAQEGYYDQGFGSGGRMLIDVGAANDIGEELALQPDGRMILAGDCSASGKGQWTFCAARLRTDGTRDLTFGPYETGDILFNTNPALAGVNSAIGKHGLALQADGRMLFAGSRSCNEWALCKTGQLVRLSANGQIEANPSSPDYEVRFAYNTTFPYNSIAAVTVAANGKIVVVGASTRAGISSANSDFGIARFNADLSPDTSFAGTGARLAAFDLTSGGSDEATAVALQADGKIVVVGYAYAADGRSKVAVLRLNSDGSSDSSFGNGGRIWFDDSAHTPGSIWANAVTLDRMGRIVVAGSREWEDSSSDQDFFVARIEPDGQIDTGFGFGGNGIVPIAFDLGDLDLDMASDAVLQADGKITVIGTVNVPPPQHFSVGAARLLPNGALDPSFGNGGKSVATFLPPVRGGAGNSEARAVAIGNGGLLIAGSCLLAQNETRFGLTKLQLDAIFADGFD